LTEAGQLLLTACRETLDNYDSVLAAVDALKGLRRGRVRLASVETVSLNLLPRLIAEFRRPYPGIEVRLTVTGSDQVTSLVARREADLGFTFNPESLEGLEVAWSQALPIGAVMATDHPLARRSPLTLDGCLAHPYALPARGLSLRAALERVMGRMKERPRPALEANSPRLMAALARDGGLIAFQPRVGVEQDLSAGSLVFVPLADPDLPPDELMLVRPAGRSHSAAADAFFRHALEGVKAWPVL
jgi:DNA-binding transcriptional LysR family regulator